MERLTGITMQPGPCWEAVALSTAPSRIREAKYYVSRVQEIISERGIELGDPQVSLGRRKSINCSWKVDRYNLSVLLTIPETGVPSYSGMINDQRITGELK